MPDCGMGLSDPAGAARRAEPQLPAACPDDREAVAGPGRGDRVARAVGGGSGDADSPRRRRLPPSPPAVMPAVARRHNRRGARRRWREPPMPTMRHRSARRSAGGRRIDGWGGCAGRGAAPARYRRRQSEPARAMAKAAPIAAAQAAEAPAPMPLPAEHGRRHLGGRGGRSSRGLAGARRRKRRADPAGAAGEGGPGLARCADLEDRRYPLMQPVSRIDENPVPAAAFPAAAGRRAGRHRRAAAVAIETCRGRLVLVAAVFALVFLVVALRLLTMPLFSGGTAEAHAGRVRPAAEPAAAGAGRHRRPQRQAAGDDARHPVALCRHPPDPRRARGDPGNLSVLPQLNEADVYAKLTSGKSFVWIKRPPDADAAI